MLPAAARWRRGEHADSDGVTELGIRGGMHTDRMRVITGGRDGRGRREEGGRGEDRAGRGEEEGEERSEEESDGRRSTRRCKGEEGLGALHRSGECTGRESALVGRVHW